MMLQTYGYDQNGADYGTTASTSPWITIGYTPSNTTYACSYDEVDKLMEDIRKAIQQEANRRASVETLLTLRAWHERPVKQLLVKVMKRPMPR